MSYPHMLRAACLVLLNKIDLLPHLDFDMTQAVVHLRMVNAAAAVVPVSAGTGEGLTRWYDWLRQKLAAAREAAFA